MAPISPTKFRKAALVAGIAQALIFVTGAAVRLTEAGLGCENLYLGSYDRPSIERPETPTDTPEEGETVGADDKMPPNSHLVKAES
ncbi:MAG: hypothetical protein GY724_26870 [Actinomycetia bacterium]|nr:hypothetical protein [Actinomycetes bacterium]MCP4224294.1 hypothetical protein [Actinomycetes bacterium]MCP5032738.1 hypothetical protein [Actinomycetes bacterium]